jgi:pimeloyl-ACP methyl ester carboxylesterase
VSQTTAFLVGLLNVKLFSTSENGWNMTEKMLFLQYEKGAGSQKLFLHCHLPEQPDGRAYLFLNPILDEKRRVQYFQAEAARALCRKGAHIFRFDYYGTGDSEGQSYEFDLKSALEEILFVSSYAKEYFSISNLTLLGVRCGADLAMAFAHQHPYFKNLILIEPIVNGKHYLKELKIRRLALFYLAKMKVKSELYIENKRFIDQQGYPISEENINFLEDWNLESIDIQDKNIKLYKLANQNSVEQINRLKNKCSLDNQVIYKEINAPDFWLFGINPNISELIRDIYCNY